MVSVIMPVFNTADYLEEAIQDILNQTYEDFELICVDDGSTDNSMQVLEKYASLDDRVIVLKQENKGAAEARNRGLRSASGEYVIFLDSDDRFDMNLLKIAYENAVLGEADVCVCNASFLTGKGIEPWDQPVGIPNGAFCFFSLGDDAFFKCRKVAWNKLIKRKLLTDNNIWFQNLSSSNDVYFSCRVLCASKRIIYPNTYGLILYRQDRNGQISKHAKPQNILRVVEKLMADIDERDANINRKIIELVLRGSLDELRRTNEAHVRKKFYSDVVSFIGINQELFSDCSKIQTYLKDKYLSLPFESDWWGTDGILKIQLSEKRKELVEEISQGERLVLWGCGKRGNAFIDFCSEHKIRVFGVTDRDIEKAKEALKNKAKEIVVLDNEAAIDQGDLIVAGNSVVYKMLNQKYPQVRSVNLEEFCPII